jgi:hypothetical protein
MGNVFSFNNGWSTFSKEWWMAWLQPKTYARPLRWSYQRVTRGWADCDTWNLDHHLAEWLPDALEYLKSTEHGTPTQLSEEEWNNTLNQMAEGFRAYRRIDNFPLAKEDAKLFKSGMKLFVKHFSDLWN